MQQIKLTQYGVPNSMFVLVGGDFFSAEGNPTKRLRFPQPHHKDYENSTVLIQSEDDLPALARTFGWSGEDLDTGAAHTFLINHLGCKVDDPGYFEIYASGRH
jgi:hypothetical protein